MFDIEPPVLTGDAPLPDKQRESERAAKTQFNVSINMAARNALYLISEQYGVPPWQVVELSPFLFAWAAEASLRERQNKIREVERTCDEARQADCQIKHMPIANFTNSEETASPYYLKLASILNLREPLRLMRFRKPEPHRILVLA